MREAGFVQFEGYWMKPTDIEALVQARKTAALERHKLRLEIAKKQAEINAQNQRAQWLLDGDRSRGTMFINVGFGRCWHDGTHSRAFYYPHIAIPRHRCR